MPETRDRIELHRSDPTSGRWVRIVGDRDVVSRGRVRIETGVTGNRLDPSREVRRTGHDLLRADGRIELRSWWPVNEVLTSVVGQFEDDLRGRFAAAGSADPDADLAMVDEVVAGVLADGDTAEAAATGATGFAARLLRSAYPLLAVPLAQGARPGSIPQGVEPLLRHDDPRAAVRAVLCPRVTRPLVRATAAALVPDGRGALVWEPLQCALMAALRCGPEQLAAVLSAPVAQPGAVLFSLTDLDRARAMFAEIHPRRVSEILCAALSEPGGVARLATRLAEWDARPPAPAPRPPVQRTLGPPPDPATQPIAHPPTWVALAGTPVADLTVVLPRTGDELIEWGASMDNCLGAYRNTVALGRTRIMGFARGDRLIVAAEISRERVLRQLETRGNTRPDRATEVAVVAFLRAHHLVDADARRA